MAPSAHHDIPQPGHRDEFDDDVDFPRNTEGTDGTEDIEDAFVNSMTGLSNEPAQPKKRFYATTPCVGGVLLVVAALLVVGLAVGLTRGIVQVAVTNAIDRINTPLSVGPDDARYDKCPEIGVMIEERMARRKTDGTLTESCPNFGKSFPSLGGPGCPCPCKPDEQSFGTVFAAADNPWPQGFISKLARATAIMSASGGIKSLNVNGTEHGNLHMTLSYHCCVPKTLLNHIERVVRDFNWQPTEVTFSQVTCAVTGPGDAVSLILAVDDDSSGKLEELAANLEGQLATAGVNHIPHKALEQHHILLGTVEDDLFPCNQVVNQINEEVTPGTWTEGLVINNMVLCDDCF